MKKRIISLSLVLLMVFSFMVSMNMVQAETSDYPVAQANGFIAPIDYTVPSDSVFIRTASDLAAIPGGTAGAGKCFVLANDINLTAEWAPIEDFQGTLDGQGYTINNLFVLSSSYRHNAGLFATASASAVVKNLGVNVSVLGISSISVAGIDRFSEVVNVGGLIGNSSGAAIINCYVNGMMYGSADIANMYVFGTYVCVGGLVGQSSGGTITDSYATGAVNASVNTAGNQTSSGSIVGGLIGVGDGVTITNSYSTNDMSASVTNYPAQNNANAGGIAGNFNGAITNCYATGSVKSYHESMWSNSNARSGGLIGLCSDGITVISDSYAAGELTAEATREATPITGGLIAARTNGANVTITNSYNVNDVVRFTITATASPTNGGTVKGGGTFVEGDTVTLQATPTTGWTFEGWFEGPTRFSTDTTITFNATANRTLEARFINVPFANPHSAWARDELTSAYNENLIPISFIGSNMDFRSSTTRAEYCALAVTLYESIIGTITGRTTFIDTNDVNVQKIASIGVVQGVGDNRFDPNAPLTREQAATMLSRLANAMGQPLQVQAATFADKGNVSSWAIEGVGQVQAAGIMTGVGDNRFAPRDPYTREQSIITMIRLFNIVN